MHFLVAQLQENNVDKLFMPLIDLYGSLEAGLRSKPEIGIDLFRRVGAYNRAQVQPARLSGRHSDGGMEPLHLHWVN